MYIQYLLHRFSYLKHTLASSKVSKPPVFIVLLLIRPEVLHRPCPVLVQKIIESLLELPLKLSRPANSQ